MLVVEAVERLGGNSERTASPHHINPVDPAGDFAMPQMRPVRRREVDPMTAIPTRIVQGVVTRPDGTPWAGKTVTAKLNTIAFIDDGTASPSLTTEIIREAYAVTNAAGLYVFKKLSVNASITQPTGTSYTLKVAGDNTILTIQVPAGDADTAVWVFDCLVADPTNPNNIVAGFPVPSGTAEVGDVPVVTQADPLEVKWGAGGGGGSGNISAWAPNTAYTTGVQVVDPNNDIAQALSNHTSGSSFATDYAGGKWQLSGTYVRVAPRTTTLTAAANVYTPDEDTTDVALIVTPSAGFTVANPSGTPSDEQKLLIKIKSGGTGFVPTWGNAYQSSGVAILPSGALPSSKTVTFGFMYDAAASKWVLLAADPTGY